MKMQIQFKHDGNYYSADFEKQEEDYAIENIRLDFKSGLADIPIKSMVIHPVVNDMDTLWIDQDGNTNDVIRAIGAAIEEA